MFSTMSAHAMSVFRCAPLILCEVGVVSGDAKTLEAEWRCGVVEAIATLLFPFVPPSRPRTSTQRLRLNVPFFTSPITPRSIALILSTDSI